MGEIKSSTETLKEYVRKKHNSYLDKFTEGDVAFLAEYCIDRNQSNTSELFKKNDIDSTYTDYFKRSETLEIREEIQYIHARFLSKKNSVGPNAFGNRFLNFMNWWVDWMNDNGEHECYYCNVNENTARAAFEKGIISSKKTSFSGELQIERLEPNKGYNSDNCRFACVLCNNAKSDMIYYKDFKDLIAPGITRYWEKIKKDSNI